MIKKIFLSIAIIISCLEIKAQIGEWELHPSYHNATKCEIMDGKIYVLASGALFSYQKEDGEIRTYNKINTLSDINISFITYSKHINAIVIVYENANIDILYSNDDIYNISDFKEKIMPDKIINGIDVCGNKAYLSTNFGIVELDLDKKEFSNTYTLNKKVYSTYLCSDKIYTATSDGLYYGQTDSNLLDNSNWKLFNTSQANSFAEFNDKLYCIIWNTTVYSINPQNNNLKAITTKDENNYRYLYNDGKNLIAGSDKKIHIIDEKENVTSYKIENTSNFIKTDGNTIWNCISDKGITESIISDNTIKNKGNSIIPESPIRNYCEYMKFTGNRLLVAGGNINYLDKKFYAGTIMEYDCENESWTNYPEEIIKNTTGIQYRNICTLDENPNQENHIFAGSFGHGLYEFKDGEFIKHYTHGNSPLESVNPNIPAIIHNYVRIPKVKFDKDGNLWVINTGTKDIIKVLKSDGNWQSINYKQIEYMPTISDIHFDSRGWIWLVSLQADAGIICIKPNGTPLDTSDDEIKVWQTNFTNLDGTSYTVYQIYGFAEDKEGKIWVGTNIGLFLIDNPQKFYNDGIFTQVKIPRNDGTGLADYLLNGVNIQTIYVDGANQKWIGTKNNGLYVISSDGQETINHFTTENSSLPSDNVVSVSMNGKTGEVFIGTSNGIASYKGETTDPMISLSENNIYAYPNPVRADYSGLITINGLTLDCNVKIVDTAGSLIQEGTSSGGTFTWNGYNKKGDRVASGVYYVLTYDKEGNEGVATKILFIR